MSKNNLLSPGLFIDDTNNIRILEPELSEKTSQLRSECNEFNEKTEQFKKIVDNFVEIIDNLANSVEKGKFKAVGSRNLLKTFEKRQNSDKQQLQTLIKEKTQQLERLRVQLDSLKREESLQIDLMNTIVSQN